MLSHDINALIDAIPWAFLGTLGHAALYGVGFAFALAFGWVALCFVGRVALGAVGLAIVGAGAVIKQLRS